MKCVIYARVSTKREEQKNSLENQISLAERMAKEHGFTIVGRYIDNGVSGTGFKNRLEITRLLNDAKSKKFDVVIAKSVSRLGRNLGKSLSLANDLEQEGICLILPEDDYDTETSKSRFMFNLKAILAEEKDNTEQLQAFKKEVERFSEMDIEDENILKQVLQRLINKIEVYEEGKIKIHYNLSPSSSS